MNEEKYRTAAELAQLAAMDRRIQAVLSGSLENLASTVYLVRTSADPADVEQWVNTSYDYLRDNLNHEDLIRAVILLQHRDAEIRALALTFLGEVSA